MVRWAQRDLFNFYGSGQSSLYSVQLNDYLGLNLDTKYFHQLVDLYSQKSFNEFTYLNIGLENDYNLTQYKKEIKNIYNSLQIDKGKYNLHPISLADFGDWFKGRFPESTPAYFYQTVDPLGQSPGHVYWYQSPFYRLGLKSENGQTKIIDFRVYNRHIYEDNFVTPNQNTDLFREVPAVIDSVKYPGTEMVLDIDLEQASIIHSKQWDLWQIAFTEKGTTLILDPQKIILAGFLAPPVKSPDLQITSSRNTTTW